MNRRLCPRMIETGLLLTPPGLDVYSGLRPLRLRIGIPQIKISYNPTVRNSLRILRGILAPILDRHRGAAERVPAATPLFPILVHRLPDC